MSHRFPSKSSRGSVLIVAMLLAAIIGISLVSYLKLANNSLKQANRSFYANSGMNIAEIGLEQAVACFNQLDNTTVAAAWTGWTLNSTPYNAATSPYTPCATRTYTGMSVGPDANASVTVYVHFYDGSGASTPIIVAKSTITQNNAPSISKYVEVTLAKRSLFANGLVARNNIDWTGTPEARSWNSDPDRDPSTAPIAYNPGASPSQNTADATVASLNGDIALSNGQVWGYAKTGPDGTITGGTVSGLDGAEDAARRTNDFNATFPVPTPPPSFNPNNITTNISSPRDFGDPASTDLRYTDPVTGAVTFYYVFSSSAVINLNGSDKIRMRGNCVFLMNNYTGTSTDAITLTGSQGLLIDASASLKIYTNGNVTLAGNSSTNANAQPSTFQIYGTNPTSQTITISGTADIKAVIDAPTADVSLNGTVTVQGAVIANHIDMHGTPDFVYDDSLANLTSGNPYRIAKWRELTQAVSPSSTIHERDYYAAPLAF